MLLCWGLLDELLRQQGVTSPRVSLEERAVSQSVTGWTDQGVELLVAEADQRRRVRGGTLPLGGACKGMQRPGTVLRGPEGSSSKNLMHNGLILEVLRVAVVDEVGGDVEGESVKGAVFTARPALQMPAQVALLSRRPNSSRTKDLLGTWVVRPAVPGVPTSRHGVVRRQLGPSVGDHTLGVHPPKKQQQPGLQSSTAGFHFEAAFNWRIDNKKPWLRCRHMYYVLGHRCLGTLRVPILLVGLIPFSLTMTLRHPLCCFTTSNPSQQITVQPLSPVPA